jgi:hypothetical protein
MDLIQDYDSSFSSSSSIRVEEENSDDDSNKQQTTYARHTITTKIVRWDHDETHVHFQRNQPHVTGNWSGHVYLNLDDEDDCTDHSGGDHVSILKDVIVDTICQFEREMNNRTSNNHDDATAYSKGRAVDRKNGWQQEEEELVIVSHVPIRTPILNHDDDDDDDDDDHVDTKKSSRLHISLSRPFYLQNHSIEPFVADLQKHIQTSIRQPLIVRIPVNVNTEEESVTLSTLDTEVLTNDEKTRSFLTVPIYSDNTDITIGLLETEQKSAVVSNGIHSIVTLVDIVMEKYGQKIYYQDPKFHISIASWKYSDQVIDRWERRKEQDERDNATNVGNDKSSSSSSSSRMMLTFILRGIHCDFGKVKRYWIPFGT